MKWPFGQCIEYHALNYRTFNAVSQIECQRKCLALKYMNKDNCVPRFVDYMLTEFDSIENRTKECSQYSGNNDVEFLTSCETICPEDCFQVNYWSTVKETKMGKYRSLRGHNMYRVEVDDQPYVDIKGSVNEEAVEWRIVWSIE